MTAEHVDWAGIYPAAMTMFDAAGAIDEAATAAHIDRLIGEGAHGIVVAGTSGEFIGLTDVERRRIITIGVRAAAGRVPVIAGTGYFSTAETIRLTEFAAEAGAQGAVVILPYYQRPEEREVFEHFRAVGRATKLPIMIYNNPMNSGAPALDATAIGALYAEGLAHAVKSTFPTVHQVHEVRAATDEGFRVFYGSFMAPLEGMAGGAHGWVSGILNVATRDAVELWQAMAVEGDLVRAREVWSRILPLKYLYTRRLLGPASDLAIYRAILTLRGAVGGHCRAPLLDLTPAQYETLRTILEPAGLVPPADRHRDGARRPANPRRSRRQLDRQTGLVR
jgi:4-hydroxy-tetrahydrodipicolinate synthase